DDVFGDVGVGPVDVLGDRVELLVGETPEGVLDHLEFGIEVAGSGLVYRGQELRGGVGADELPGVVENAGLDAPFGLAPVDAPGQLGHGIGHERDGDAGLDLTFVAVFQQASGGGDRGGG